MSLSQSRCFVLGAAVLLAGCSFVTDVLFPAPSAKNSAGSSVQSPSRRTTEAESLSGSGVSLPPKLGSTYFEPPPVTAGVSTGTFTGHKVDTYRDELRMLQDTIKGRNSSLQDLRNNAAHDALSYHETVGAIDARLMLGTTPGNPGLTEKWSGAQSQLARVSEDIVKMNQLAADVASDSAMSAFLLDSVRAAFNLQGAVEEDHRQLRILEDETNQTVVLIERLLTELSADINRQQDYVANEKSNLNTLAVAIQNGQLYGDNLGSRARNGLSPQVTSASPVAPASLPGPVSGLAGQKPLVLIRFNRPNVAYEQALYQAIGRALERRPSATFDLVAVTPSTDSPGKMALNANAARRNAEAVLRSIQNMGLPSDRIRLSAMNSPDATTSEVHIYVR
ncbi:MAG: hypothetical protein HQL37_08575 [Alphaproteobacteria bacterium]|nr:hypothetical protein [Alphaproteobacteria bacterium]